MAGDERVGIRFEASGGDQVAGEARTAGDALDRELGGGARRAGNQVESADGKTKGFTDTLDKSGGQVSVFRGALSQVSPELSNLLDGLDNAATSSNAMGAGLAIAATGLFAAIGLYNALTSAINKAADAERRLHEEQVRRAQAMAERTVTAGESFLGAGGTLTPSAERAIGPQAGIATAGEFGVSREQADLLNAGVELAVQRGLGAGVQTADLSQARRVVGAQIAVGRFDGAGVADIASAIRQAARRSASGRGLSGVQQRDVGRFQAARDSALFRERATEAAVDLSDAALADEARRLRLRGLRLEGFTEEEASRALEPLDYDPRPGIREALEESGSGAGRTPSVSFERRGWWRQATDLLRNPVQVGTLIIQDGRRPNTEADSYQGPTE